MKVLKENRVIDVDIKSLLSKQKVVDYDVQTIENSVAGFYGVSVYDLDTFYRDSEAKLMTCFLCHHLLDMSIGLLSKRYNVFRGFLRNKIQEYYEKCLTETEFMEKVMVMKNIIQKDSCEVLNG